MEAVIYVALFVSLSVCLIDVMLVLSKAYTEVRVNRDLLDSSQSIVERMSREIRTATSIDASSVLDANPGSLVLHTSGGTRTMQFILTGSTLNLSDNGGAPVALSGQSIAVTSLVFHTITTAAGKAVRLELVVESLRSATHKSVSLSDTVVLRGSY